MSDVEKEVKGAAYNTWQSIASDWMEGFDMEESDLTTHHIAEAVFDADRITTFNPDLSPEALQYIKDMEWPKDMIELCMGLA